MSKPLSLIRTTDLDPILSAQRAWRSAHRRVVQFKTATDTIPEAMRLALEQQDQALAQIERLDPVWAESLRREYGV